MSSVLKQVCVPFTPILSRFHDSSSLETEALYGEKIEILSQKDNWYYGKLTTDGYEGWIKKSDLDNVNKVNSRVAVSLSIINHKPTYKSRSITFLPMGSLVNAFQYNEQWSQVKINLKKQEIFGFIPRSHISKIGSTNKDWINYSKSFLSSPYKWGGRTYLGIDCSAFLQLLLQIAGVNIPRNTNDQINANCIINVNKSVIKKGDIVFWPGHVGIMVSPSKIIHSNATTSNNIIQKLKDVDLKIYEQTGFSYKVYRLKKIP